MTGVSGPLMDTFFLGGNFGRREIVATKATCQVASHFTKLIYFGGIIDQAATLDPVLAASRSRPRCSAPRWRGASWKP